MANSILFVILFLLFIGYCTLNLSSVKRYAQWSTPIAALVFTIYCFIFSFPFNNLILDELKTNTGFIKILSELSTTPEAILPFLNNIVILLSFILLKIFLLLIAEHCVNIDIKNIKNNTIFYEIHKLCSKQFYIYYPDKEKSKPGKWIANPKYRQVRYIFKGAFIGSVICSFVVIILASLDLANEWFIYMFGDTDQRCIVPFIGTILLGECFFHLDGETTPPPQEEEKEEEKSEPTKRNPDLDELRLILRNEFGNRDLYDVFSEEPIINNNIHNTINQLQVNKSDTDKLAGAYFNALYQRQVPLNGNDIQSALALLKQKSQLIFNPFYQDLTPYLILPMLHQFLQENKCLVIVGRENTSDDVCTWLNKAFCEATGTSKLWLTAILSNVPQQLDCGILKFQDLYNLELLQQNKEFLDKVTFVFLIEPSRILSTSQMGLSILVSKIQSPQKTITYCACDHNCDGLIDCLSHTLKTEFTQVEATISNNSASSKMYWQADGPMMHMGIMENVGKYLGVGLELSAVAAKYKKIPTIWLTGNKFPAFDIKDIRNQEYISFCKYIDLPQSQEELEIMKVDPNLWNQPTQADIYLTVEDEFRNLFEISRLFQSRATKQSFINVISENYLLRDYMLENAKLFTADPKAIPNFAPDFAQTERNATIKLMMLLAGNDITEESIRHEFKLFGLESDDVVSSLESLIKKHCNISSKDIIKVKTLPGQKKVYALNKDKSIENYCRSLQTAYFIPEDGEKDHNLGAKLYGHVFQSYLPNQYVTLEGKYYSVINVSPKDGIVVKRAQDNIDHRVYYRQLRHISMTNWTYNVHQGGQKTINEIAISYGFATFNVSTTGFLSMDSYDNLKQALYVSTDDDIPDRTYRNKSILRITMPGLTENGRFIVCLLLNEIFRTTYPDACNYVCAVTEIKDYDQDSFNNLLYEFNNNSNESSDNSIFILEDSEIDLGLIVSVEKNIKRYFQIIYAFISWHLEMVATVNTPKEPVQEPVLEPISEPPASITKKNNPERVEKNGCLSTILPFLKANQSSFENEAEPENINIENEISHTYEPLPPLPFNVVDYQNHCYLKYGFDDYHTRFNELNDVLTYLEKFGFNRSGLQQRRDFLKNKV